MQYLILRERYGVSIEDYFAYGLFNRSEEAERFLRETNKYKRRWSAASSKCAVEKSSVWLFWHHIDFLISKLIYPGLDAADYFRYEFYNFRYSKRKTFITEGELKKIDQAYNGGRNTEVLTNKTLFNKTFSKYVFRKWISSEDIFESSFEEFCRGLEKVIVKPEKGYQGRGIFIADVSRPACRKKLFKTMKQGQFIAEELVVQDSEINKLNPMAVNSIRIYSVEKDGVIHITSAVLRIGDGVQPTDNYSAGGMAATIDIESGIVISGAINKSNERFFVHPVTRQKIIGFSIPKWNDLLAAVKSAHILISEIRYIAWDAAVTDDGRITFLEGNIAGGVGLQQHPMLTGKKDLYRMLL